ncbi:MAG TPA: DUF4235 domain-containing protein [Actinomycetes bacterium]|nr:DUF4235 domain-containing protein [Actinomycetes bacterium]
MTTSEESEDSAGPPQVVITLVALAAGLVAQKAVSAGWRFIRGTDPNDDDSPLPEILVFAAVSAATVAVAKNWATHRAKALSSGRADS